MSLASFTTIPVIGWILGPAISACAAIPFYVLWHGFNIKKFFYFLPDIYINAGFWDMVGLFIVGSFIKSIFFPSTNITNNCKGDD